MRVYCYPADEWGCGSYRVIFVAEALRAQGHDVTLRLPSEGSGLSGLVSAGRRLVRVFAPDDADVMVLQRPTSTILAQAVPKLRERGIAVVVDVDDDLANIHPANPAWAMLHPKRNPLNNWANVALACRQASLVTVSTPALVKRYGAHGRVRVLRNHVPERYLQVPRPPDRERPAVGWPGSLHSHPDDLRPAAGALGRLAREGWPVHVVGSGEGIAREIGTDRYTSAGVVEFADWPRSVAELDVGVAPLADTVFNAAKSWLKPLEMAAVGVPWVASGLPEYAALARLGGGTVARRDRDWWRDLNALLRDDGLRAERSAEAREVAGTLTVEGHAWRWAEAWQAAHEVEHPRIPA